MVMAQLNCAFVFTYAKSRFSADAAHKIVFMVFSGIFLAQNITGRKLLVQAKLGRNYEFSARHSSKIFEKFTFLYEKFSPIKLIPIRFLAKK